jgi:hypothetical protein
LTLRRLKKLVNKRRFFVERLFRVLNLLLGARVMVVVHFVFVASGARSARRAVV